MKFGLARSWALGGLFAAALAMGACEESGERNPAANRALQTGDDAAIEDGVVGHPEGQVVSPEVRRARCAAIDLDDRPVGTLTDQPCEPSGSRAPVCSDRPETDPWGYECFEGSLRVVDFTHCHPNGKVTCERHANGSVGPVRTIKD